MGKKCNMLYTFLINAQTMVPTISNAQRTRNDFFVVDKKSE